MYAGMTNSLQWCIYEHKAKTVEGFTKKDILKTLFNKVLKGTTSVHSCGKTMSNSKSY
jgi:predicted GIY-YIG superfamily endonuclease